MIDVWTLVVVALPLIGLWLAAMIEVVRRHDLNGVRSVAWIGALLVLPLIAVVAYIVVRPPRAAYSGHRTADCTAAEAIVVAAERRQRGEIDDDEYRQAVSAATR